VKDLPGVGKGIGEKI